MRADSVFRQPDPDNALGHRSRLNASIDLGRLRGAQFATDIASGRVTSSSHAFALSYDRSVGDSHVEGSRLVVALGNPTLAGKPARASDLATVADEKLDRAVGGRYVLVIVDADAGAVRVRTDRFGVWPLCWTRNGDQFAFSDRADEVQVPERVLDPQALLDYVYFHMIPAPRTVYRDVRRLEPATELRASLPGMELRSTWRPTFARRRDGEVDELAEQFRNIVRDAVAAEANGPGIGCFLSGGTDSSTVSGMLKSVTGMASTFSIGFDADGYDEMAYARIAARHFGTDHHEHYVTPGELVTAIPGVAAHYDGPFGNSSAVPAYICATVARSHGVRKLLAGDGGDELFGGNSRYAKQKVFEAWWSIPGVMRCAVAPAIANGLTRRLPLARKAASYVDQASVPMPLRLETYNLLKRFGHDSVFRPELLAQVDREAPQKLQAEVYARHAGAPFVDRMLAYDWRFTLADNDLPKVCGTTRLAGLEVGFPLLADALLDLSLRIGPGDKVRGLKLRQFFKQSLSGFLPPEIIAKKKHGFGLPVGVWLVRDAPFRALARDSLNSLSARGVIQSQLVDDLFSRRLEEHAGYYGEMVWILMMLEQWLQSHHPGWRL